MNGLDYKNDSIIYTDSEGEAYLINANDYLSNISPVPLHGDDDAPTAAKLVLSLMSEHAQFTMGTPFEERTPYYTVIDALVCDYFLKHCGAKMEHLRVAEMGCTNGIMSYHLASVMGYFDRETTLCGITDAIGNDSGNMWIDNISSVQNPPNVSMIASDYDCTNLKDNHFDIVIVNGSVRFENPGSVLKEAKRIVKDEGRLIVFADSQPLIESVFCLQNKNRKEYCFSPDAKILVSVS